MTKELWLHTAVTAAASPGVHWKYFAQQEHLHFICWNNVWGDAAVARKGEVSHIQPQQ